MKKVFKILGILAIIGAVAGLMFYVFVINKSHPDYEKLNAEYTLPATDLYDQYKNEKEIADQKYNGKMLEVFGTINKVEISDSMLTAVFVFEEGMFGDEGLRVTMLPAYNDGLKDFSLPGSIRLKAYCTGFNDVDVVLIKGSIVKN
jgi:putative nucleic acid binding protein